MPAEANEGLVIREERGLGIGAKGASHSAIVSKQRLQFSFPSLLLCRNIAG
jgi:hypothetical protein